MFEILKKENVTCDELGELYVKAEEFKKQLEFEAQEKLDLLLELQGDFLGKKGNPPKDLQQAKSDYFDINIQIKACDNDLEKIKARIMVLLPVECQSRINDAKKEIVPLKQEEKEKRFDFLRKAARAVVINEEINWRSLSFGHMGMKEDFPTLNIDPIKLDDQDRKVFLNEVEKNRQESTVKSMNESIKGRKGKILTIIRSCEKIIADYNPEKEFEKILAKYRPKEDLKSIPDDPKKISSHYVEHFAPDYDGYNGEKPQELKCPEGGTRISSAI